MLKKTNLAAILSFFLFFIFSSHFTNQYPAFSSITPHENKYTDAIQSGERLEFSINWMGIKAGKAILEVGKPTSIGENKAFHITSTARSNDFISRFFPVEDRVETFMDVDRLVPLRFKSHQREGKRIKDREVNYDQINHKVSQLEEGKEETFDIAPGAQDALSVL